MEVCVSGSRCAVINGDEFWSGILEVLPFRALYILFISSVWKTDWQRQIEKDQGSERNKMGKTYPRNSNYTKLIVHVIIRSCWRQRKTFWPHSIFLVATKNILSLLKKQRIAFFTLMWTYTQMYSDKQKQIGCENISQQDSKGMMWHLILG